MSKAKNVDGLRQVVCSKSNEVTELLVTAFNEDPDPQVKIMAIDSLGLTSDPKAVRVLMEVFKDSMGYSHQIAVLSLANVVANRMKSPEAIPSLTLIAKDKSLNTMVRGQAIMALCRFRKDDVDVEQYLTGLKNNPNEEIGIKIAAM